MKRVVDRLRLVSLVVLLGVLASIPVAAETQTIHFPSPGWHFVSLSVRPASAGPLDVFPPDVAFTWDHLWGFDPADGWRHFSPDAAVPGLLNDLAEIEPLRGYWIHVTRVSEGGFDLAVDGTRVSTFELDPAIDRADRWQAIGPLLESGEGAANVETIFGELGASLPTLLLEVWDYDEATGSFHEITSYGGSCASTPDDCMEEGQGYWVRTDGRIQLGPQLELSTDGIVLSAENPLESIGLQYAGGIGVAARLRAVDPDAGLHFIAARVGEIDGARVMRSDLLGDPAGPDTSADLDGDLVPEPCPDLCAAIPSCVSLCFDGGSALGEPEAVEHTVFAFADYRTLVDPQTPTTNLQPGSAPHTRLALEILPSGAIAGAEADPVAYVDVAVQASTVAGVYAGSLVYEEPSFGKLPLTLWLADPVGRLAGVINPKLQTSRQNGFDEDGDGEVDEPDEGEGRIVPTRTASGFSSETTLVGGISSDGLAIWLDGTSTVLPELAFAGGPDGGLASAFTSAARTLSLEGERLESNAFEGFFADRFENVALGGGGETVSYGRFYLERVAGPTCMVPIDYADPLVEDDDRPVVIDIDCRTQMDCPGRCTGAPALEGFFCTSDDDCKGNLVDGVFDPVEGQVVPVSQGFVTGACERLVCAFAEYAPGSKSAMGASFEEARVSLAGLDRPASVRLLGAESRTFILDLGSATIDAGYLACGDYTVEVVAPGCEIPSPVTFDPCTNPGGIDELALGPLVCPGPPVFGDQLVTSAVAGNYVLTGGAPLLGDPGSTGGTAPDEVALSASAGEPVAGGRDLDVGWTSEVRAQTIVLRAGLEEVLR